MLWKLASPVPGFPVPRVIADRLLHPSALDAVLAGLAALCALVVAAFRLRRRREEARARALLEEAVRMELDLPPSLHPVIDPDVCIGSGSCLTVCPEGGILGLVDGVAKLVSASHCIGHGRCAAECPVNAIKLVFGSAERGVDLPELDSHFETSRVGVHIVGELAGMGLIKNALIQGMQVGVRLRDTLDRSRPVERGVFDVAIVGAGPAGIATAVAARAAGLSFAVLEQDAVGGTIAHYPRQKLVMSESVPLPFYGLFGRTHMSKEDLMDALADVMTRAKVKVQGGVKVTGLEGELDAFVVKTSRGSVRARRVVLAIGRRGSPRPIGAPGEDLPKVTYRLVDPAQYRGQRVMVVGGGDSALEAAIMLAEEGGECEISIVYRRPEFARCRPLNKQKIAALLASGRVRAFMSMDIAAIEPELVRLKDSRAGGGGEAATQPIPNDFLIACLGGELPTEFLKSMGIGIRRHLGDRAMANPALNAEKRVRAERTLSPLTLTLVGAAVLAVLGAVGRHYYRLPQSLRYQAAEHAWLRPSGLWGHGVGIVATLFMLSNFIYSLRKRLRRFKGKGSIAPWLRFHAFVGLMSPLTILFHSAFQWGNHLATGTYVSLAVVVSTGLVGRYLYGMVKLAPAHVAQIGSMRQSLTEALDRLALSPARPEAGAQESSRRSAKRRSDGGGDEAAAEPGPDLAEWRASVSGPAPARGTEGGWLISLLGGLVRTWLLARSLAPLRTRFRDGREFERFRAQAIRLRRFELRLSLHHRFKRLMNVWRVFHVTLAILLLALIGLHVWISVRVGFKWIWS